MGTGQGIVLVLLSFIVEQVSTSPNIYRYSSSEWVPQSFNKNFKRLL